jgi:hypothetical protein
MLNISYPIPHLPRHFNDNTNYPATSQNHCVSSFQNHCQSLSNFIGESSSQDHCISSLDHTPIINTFPIQSLEWRFSNSQFFHLIRKICYAVISHQNYNLVLKITYSKIIRERSPNSPSNKMLRSSYLNHVGKKLCEISQKLTNNVLSKSYNLYADQFENH